MGAIVVAAEAIKLDHLGSRLALRTFIPLTPGGPVGDLHIASVGEWKGHQAGAFELTRADLSAMAAQFDEQANPMLVDYDHNSLLGGSPDAGKAAGWVQGLQVREGAYGAELWGKVEWTTTAAELIKNGEYRYCSPVIDTKTVDRKTGEEVDAKSLFNVAITNQPFFDGNHPIKLTRVATAKPKPKAPPPADAPADAPPPPAPAPPPDPAVAAAPPADAPPAAPGEPDAEDKQPGDVPNDPSEPPEPTEPALPGAEPAQNVEDAQLTTAIDSLMAIMNVDRPAVVAALTEYADQVGSLLNLQLERDGMPSEGRATMSDKPKDPKATPPAPPATTPVKIEDATRAAEIEAKAKEDQLITLSARVERMEAADAARKAKEDAERQKLIERHVDGLIAAGRVRDTMKADAVWLFSQDWDRAERTFADKIVPIGTTQAGGSDPAAPVADVDPEKATKADLTEDERGLLTQLVASRMSEERAVKHIVKNRKQIAASRQRFVGGTAN